MSKRDSNFKLQFVVVLMAIQVCFCVQGLNETKEEYLRKRKEFLREERNLRTGHTISLTPDEQKANQVLMAYKSDEIDDALEEGTSAFPPSMHFFKAKAMIHHSIVFQILRTMPKGRLTSGQSPNTGRKH